MNQAISLKRETVCDWSLLVGGKEIGGIHKFVRGGRVTFCHDLLVRRGATFSTLQAAATDMAARAAE